MQRQTSRTWAMVLRRTRSQGSERRQPNGSGRPAVAPGAGAGLRHARRSEHPAISWCRIYKTQLRHKTQPQHHATLTHSSHQRRQSSCFASRPSWCLARPPEIAPPVLPSDVVTLVDFAAPLLRSRHHFFASHMPLLVISLVYVG